MNLSGNFPNKQLIDKNYFGNQDFARFRSENMVMVYLQVYTQTHTHTGKENITFMDPRIEELTRITENHHDILSHQRFCFKTTNGIVVHILWLN